MKQLVFALMLQTWNGGILISSELIAHWYDINDCIYFARQISLQAQKAYEIPVDSYCIPTWLDEDSEAVIF